MSKLLTHLQLELPDKLDLKVPGATDETYHDILKSYVTSYVDNAISIEFFRDYLGMQEEAFKKLDTDIQLRALEAYKEKPQTISEDLMEAMGILDLIKSQHAQMKSQEMKAQKMLKAIELLKGIK